MQKTVIEIAQLTKMYGENKAVSDLTLSIKEGEVFGLLGPNGAGKSTTILMILGLSEPTSGAVKVFNHDSTRSPMQIKKLVGYLPDNVGFYEDLTGIENLVYTARLNGFSKQDALERATALLEQVGLKESMNKKAGKYSRGMRQRLGLADVLIKKPKIVILDEPTLGLDPKGVQELLTLIETLSKEQGITVLLSSHQLHQVQQICDRVGLFVKGSLLAVGKVEQLAHELFSQEGVVISAKVSSVTKEVYDEILSLEDVIAVKEEKNNELVITCKHNIADEIAKVVYDRNLRLYELTTKTFGLDEIYHRYFEGGDDGYETVSVQ